MKKKLSVRGFQDYINSGTRLEFRAFNSDWAKLYPSDAKKARKLWVVAEEKLRDDAYAEALLLSNGDIMEAEHMLIEKLIAPPSFTSLSDCTHCGILPARKPPLGMSTSCSWCGLISCLSS